MTISYAITACNETEELERLLDQLQKNIRPEDEIIVLLDSKKLTPETEEIAVKYNVFSKCEYHRIFHNLEGDFSEFKNFLMQHCTRDYIFFIDADEYLSTNLLHYIAQMIEVNQVDCFRVPRANIVYGITADHIRKWGWNMNENEWINWPDYQTRICKNGIGIKWINKVHERLDGWKTICNFPSTNDDWALLHIKTIGKQEKQNSFYNGFN